MDEDNDNDRDANEPVLVTELEVATAVVTVPAPAAKTGEPDTAADAVMSLVLLDEISTGATIMEAIIEEELVMPNWVTLTEPPCTTTEVFKAMLSERAKIDIEVLKVMIIADNVVA